MKLRKCGCKQCRYGLRRKGQSSMVTAKVRAGRRKSHQQLHELEKEVQFESVCQCRFPNIEPEVFGPDFCVRCGHKLTSEYPETEIDKEIDVGYTD